MKKNLTDFFCPFLSIALARMGTSLSYIRGNNSFKKTYNFRIKSGMCKVYPLFSGFSQCSAKPSKLNTIGTIALFRMFSMELNECTTRGSLEAVSLIYFNMDSACSVRIVFLRIYIC